jgi:endonuclease-3 related protein
VKRTTHDILMQFYDAMAGAYGKQYWWPADDPFEVMVGAVLTQNTNWKNVEKALDNLKAAEVMDPFKMHALSQASLASLIKPAGYFNVKSKRLKNLLAWFCDQHDGSFEAIAQYHTYALQEELINIKGVGRETADAIILYAFNKPTFVIDRYTHRILTRHGLIDMEATYDDMKQLFEGCLPDDLALYNEYHALIVQVGKNHCKPKAKCEGCPLAPFDHCETPD